MLWDGSRIRLPRLFHSTYQSLLEQRGWAQLARDGTDEKEIHGGLGQTETEKHFLYRFAGSAVRFVAVFRDPGLAFGNIPLNISRIFGGGAVSMLDVACGSGAGVASVVSSLAQQREDGLLPTLPLTIHAIGADFSDTALAISRDFMSRLAFDLPTLGIEVDWTTRRWDATQTDETSQLVDAWLESNPLAERFVLIMNVSGPARSLIKQFEPSFQHIRDRLSNKHATLLWLEPSSDSATKLLQGVRLLFQKVFGPGPDQVLSWNFSWHHSIQERDHRGSVLVEHYVR